MDLKILTTLWWPSGGLGEAFPPVANRSFSIYPSALSKKRATNFMNLL
jgi:hypothetical protein